MTVGTYRKYVEKRFSEKSLHVVRTAAAIVEEYEAQGIVITVRSLYYQFVARDLLANTQRNYDKLAGLVSDGRLAGLISWSAIEDVGRQLHDQQYYESPLEVLEAAHKGYKMDKWVDQPFRPEALIEKDALLGVIGPVCYELGLPFMSCKGYASQTALWQAGRRMAGYVRQGQRPIVFHLGDHDPSGVDMTRDIQERLSMFTGIEVQVVRLALNMEQVERYNPPPNPLKLRADGELSDSRGKAYLEQFGESSWELDALEPKALVQLIRDAVASVRDEAKWNAALLQEVADKKALSEVVEQFKGDE